MSDHDPSIEASLLAALKREMQRPADESARRDVAARLGPALGIGLSIAAPAAAAAPASLPSASVGGSAALKLLVAGHPLLAPLGVLVGSAALTGLSLFGVLSFSEPQPAEPTSVAAVPRRLPERSRGVAAQTASGSPGSAASASPEPSATTFGPARASGTATPPASITPPATSAPPAGASLSAQQALLDTARRALSRGDSRDALSALGQHATRFPNSVLSEEREALLVKALRAANRSAEANERAARFAARYPTSVFLPSVAPPSIP